MPNNAKRTYNSEKRKALAQKTKELILSTAKKLFEKKGFENVTIEEIAQKAGVAGSTIYALFQSKTGLLRVLMDNALDPERYMELLALVQKRKKETSIIKRLEVAAIIARQMYDAEAMQLGSLQNASILSPEFKKLEKEREERRYERLQDSFEAMIKEHPLPKETGKSKAQDVLWAFTGRDLYRMLVLERGWSSDEYEKWLTNSLVKMIYDK